jgi:ATP-dependent Clp protease ATP-binding subunit ClpA
MPKINVYLPDELAESVKQTGVPVSAICQRALEQSVKRVAAIRAATLGDLTGDSPLGKLSHFTDRAKTALKTGIEHARAMGAPAVGTEHLLHGVLHEGDNLALHILRALDVDPEHLARRLADAVQPAANEPASSFGGETANALELAVTEAIALGHNYIGCEHLLLGLVAESEGLGGQVLRGAGLDPRGVRAAVVAAAAGYAHLRSGQSASSSKGADVLREALRPLVERIERLEKRLGD